MDQHTYQQTIIDLLRRLTLQSNPAAGLVFIVDQDGVILDTVSPPAKNEVAKATGIHDQGPPYNNAIIDAS